MTSSSRKSPAQEQCFGNMYGWTARPFLLAEYTGANAGMYFYLNDHLGTPQQLLNGETGAVAWQAAYLPFGEAQVQVSVVTNNLRFSGQYYNAETGLHYNWNRYYDPKSGRYVSADPVGVKGGLNLYIYVRNNSINLIDFDGLLVYNYSGRVVYIKPESTVNGKHIIPINSGDTYSGAIDGFCAKK